MKCDEIKELMLDAAMGGEGVPGMNEHLLDCPACAGKLQEMRKTMALLDEWQAPEPSPYFDTRLAACIREEGQWLRFQKSGGFNVRPLRLPPSDPRARARC